MTTTRERLVETLCSLLERGVGLVLEYNEGHPDFHLPAVRSGLPFLNPFFFFLLCFVLFFLKILPRRQKKQISKVIWGAVDRLSMCTCVSDKWGP